MGRDVTQFLIDVYHGNAERNIPGISRFEKDPSDDGLQESLQDMSESFQDNYGGRLTGASDINWARLWRETYPQEFMHKVRDIPANDSRGLREAAIEIQGSAFDQYYTRCTSEIYTQLMCPRSPFGTEDCFNVINRPCSDNEGDRRECQIIPLYVDPCCDVGVEGKRDVHWVAPSGRFCVKYPRLCETHIGYALNRSVFECRPGAAQFLQDIMENGITESLRYQDEILRIRMMFGLDGLQQCSYPFFMDEVKYESGYQASTAGLWTNVICGAAYAISQCDQSILCAIEEIFDDARDPFTCKPNSCAGDLQLAIPRRCKIQNYQGLISPARHHYLNATTQDCNADIERAVGAREGWSSTVKYSDYMYDELVNFYLTQTFECSDGAGGVTTYGPAADAYTAGIWAANTYLVSKSFQDTFGWMVDYDIRTEEMSGTNTEAYFEQGIMLRKIFSYKRTPGWRNPWKTVLVRAFAPQTNPISP